MPHTGAKGSDIGAILLPLSGRLPRAWRFAVPLLAVAALIRLLKLGVHGFWSEELLHVFAARSILDNGSLEVPMWGDYRFARPVTAIVAAAFWLFGESEFSARLPFVVLNVAFLA